MRVGDRVWWWGTHDKKVAKHHGLVLEVDGHLARVRRDGATTKQLVTLQVKRLFKEEKV